MAGRRRRKGGQADDHDERWLVSYADMVTLLLALFIVLFAMANVNTSKYEELKESLSGAFTNALSPSANGLAKAGEGIVGAPVPGADDPVQAENDDLRALKERVDAYAAEHGLSDKLAARIERRGLVITVLTDKLLFASGEARLQGEGATLLAAIGGLLRAESEHRVVVEGYTDSVPIASAQFPSNWELSTARASAVVRALIASSVAPQRLSATGRAHLDAVASNATAGGRARNRRVQIVLPRLEAAPIGPAPAISFPEPGIGPQEP